MLTDWRGTVINEGALVVYGAPVGRSIQQVEGRVKSFTDGDRVNVEIIRRSYSSAGAWGRKVVHVGPDRLTVVESLPPTDLPEWGDKVDAAKDRAAERNRIWNTHDVQRYEEWEEGPRRKWLVSVHRCSRCGASSFDAGKEICHGTQ